MSTDSTWVAPVVADGEQPLPYPPQFIMPAPVAPAEVTEAIGALRVACAPWATSTVTPAEAHACDTVLGRHTEAYQASAVTVVATLFAVAYVGFCKQAVRERTRSRFEDVGVYLVCAGLGLLPGAVSGLLLCEWSGVDRAFSGAGAAAGAGMLSALRWLRARGEAPVSS